MKRQPAGTRQLTGRRTEVVVGATGCPYRPAPVEVLDARAGEIPPAGAGLHDHVQLATECVQAPSRLDAAGCTLSIRPGLDRAVDAKPAHVGAACPGRVNPLEPLREPLKARLREIRREMQDGSARVRKEALGRGSFEGPARVRTREGTS